MLLFRYSALTFNGHRLLDLLHRNAPAAEVTAFGFRALRPSFDGRPLRVNGRIDGKVARLWAQDDEGWLTMDATATLARAA